MATLVRDVERPAFLDRPAEGQLSFGAAVAPQREEGTRRPGLAERLRAERAAEARAGGAQSLQTDAVRGGGATLDELLVGAWEGLSSRHPVSCPVCSGPMQPRAAAAGGACGDCGAQLR
jgi:hypothetical protein